MPAMIALVLGITLLAPGASAARADELADRLPGTYTIVSGVRGDAAVEADRLAGKVVITRESITLDAGGDGEFLIPYTLEPGGKIAMKIAKAAVEGAVGSTARGLVKVEGDTLTLIYDYQDGRSPADFTPDDAMQHRFVLKRQAK